MLSQNTDFKAVTAGNLPVVLKLPLTDRSSAALEIQSGVMKATDEPLAINKPAAATEKTLHKKNKFIDPESEYKNKIAGYGIGVTLLSGAAVLVWAGVSYGIANSSALNWPLIATTATALAYGIAKTGTGLIKSITSWLRDKNSAEMLLDRQITREVKNQLKEDKGFISRLYYEYPAIAPILGTAVLMTAAIAFKNVFNDFLNNNQLVAIGLAFSPLFHLVFGQFYGLEIDQTKERLHPNLYRPRPKL